MLAIILALLFRLGFLVFKSPPMEISEIEIAQILFNIPQLFLRIIGLLITFSSSYIFALIATKTLKTKQKHFFTLFFLLFFFSPWQNLLSTFLPIQNILLLILLTVLLIKNKWIFIVLPIVIVITVIFLTHTEKNYIFINSLKPSKLAFEINERQKIDYLAVNKKYILPSLFRKITYNKPTLALNKLTGHLISFFDFDYWSSPIDSYALIKLSGYTPKANIPLLYIWEIPLIISGIILLKQKKVLLILSLVALIPFLIFETKILAKSAYLISPVLLFLEAYALSKINFGKLSVKMLAFIMFIIPLFSFYKFFYFTPEVYQTPHGVFFKQISLWIDSNRNTYQNIVISPKFGAVQKATDYYLHDSNNLNITYEEFDLKNNNPKPDIVYIGLVGEFVGKGKDIEEKEPLNGILVLQKIKANEEIVFEYGKEIWIGKQY